MRSLFCLAPAAALLAAPAAAADRPALPAGNYYLSMFPAPTTEVRLAVVKVTAGDDGPAAAALDGGSQDVGVSGLRRADGRVTADVSAAGGQTKLRFEGAADPADPGRVYGVLVVGGGRVIPAAFTPTAAAKFAGPADERPEPDLPADLAEAERLQRAAGRPAFLARREADPDRRRELLAEAAEARKAADQKAPPLLRKVVADHPDTAAAAAAAAALLGRADALRLSADEAAKLTDAVLGFSRKFGPRAEQSALARLVAQLAAADSQAAATAALAGKGLAAADVPPAVRAGLLKALVAAREKGNDPGLAAARAELDRVEKQLDDEYEAKVPPFQPAKYRGRPDPKANRTAVVELFTGAQCPPCVAADVAFDALAKAYRPADLVLVQYHLHIPGPDPLTSPAALARQDYYTAKFADGIRGTPSTFVGGKPAAAGGGPLDAAADKFDEYRQAVDKLLADAAPVTLTGSAKRAGDVVSAEVAVAGGHLPAAVKLRLLLAEAHVRYPGPNGVRFHHNVARGFVGPADGVAVKDLADGKHTAQVDVAALRNELADYLTTFAKETAPFPTAERPLALTGLKVVALVQNDDTREILQAVELPVADK